MQTRSNRNNRVVRFSTHLGVCSAVSAVLLPTTSSEISYALAEFSNEFKNENHEGHDFHNIFNAEMQAVALKKKKKEKEKSINITEK